MSYIEVEVESNTAGPFNSRFRVNTEDTVGSLLDKIDFEDLQEDIISPELAILKYHGKTLPRDSTFAENHIGYNDVLELTIRE